MWCVGKTLLLSLAISLLLGEAFLHLFVPRRLRGTLLGNLSFLFFSFAISFLLGEALFLRSASPLARRSTWRGALLARLFLARHSSWRSQLPLRRGALLQLCYQLCYQLPPWRGTLLGESLFFILSFLFRFAISHLFPKQNGPPPYDQPLPWRGVAEGDPGGNSSSDLPYPVDE